MLLRERYSATSHFSEAPSVCKRVDSVDAVYSTRGLSPYTAAVWLGSRERESAKSQLLCQKPKLGQCCASCVCQVKITLHREDFVRGVVDKESDWERCDGCVALRRFLDNLA